jgi:hypothetical protein
VGQGDNLVVGHVTYPENESTGLPLTIAGHLGNKKALAVKPGPLAKTLFAFAACGAQRSAQPASLFDPVNIISPSNDAHATQRALTQPLPSIGSRAVA